MNEQSEQDFETLTFDAFNSQNVLLNDEIDPDINLFQEKTFPESTYYNLNEAKNKLLNENRKSLSIFHLNIRSLKKNFEDFKYFLNELNFEFKIICLSETWCQSDELTNSLYNIPNYVARHQIRKHSKGGGVSIYIHKSLMFKMRPEISINNEHIESLCVEILNEKKRNSFINVVYRRPSGDYRKLHKYLKEILKLNILKNKPVYLTGDFNLNLLDHDTHSNVKDYVNLLFENGFLHFINKPTRITRYSSTLIDHFISNTNSDNIDTGIIKTDISDHFPIFFIANNEELFKKGEKQIIRKREINANTLNSFKEILKPVNWTAVTQCDNVNSAYDNFLNIVSSLYDTVFPIKEIKLKTKTLLSPWMSRGLLKCSKHKKRLYENFLKKRTIQNETKYKNYKKLFDSIKNKSKKNHYANLLKLYQKDIKKTWKVIKEVIGSKKSENAYLPKKIISNGVDITDHKSIAENFNSFFTHIGPKLASTIPETQRNFESYLDPSHNTYHNSCLTDKELKEAISSLKLNKSPGFDEINSNVVKECSEELFIPLKHIFNLSLNTGIFPDQLKIARVTPLYKSGENTCVSNYRPISVLPCFSKILERIMYNRLYKFLNENNILYQKQFGFRNSHSTEHAIMQLVDQIFDSFNDGKYTLGVFIDLSKAFDTVDHDILIKKLYLYGLRGNAIEWFKSYLSNRKQFIVYDRGKTGFSNITCGVPQGSILGPLLFLIYVNDLKQATNILDPIMFADDTNLFHSGHDIKTLFKSVNKELIQIKEWFQANKLSLNVKKTKYTLFHSVYQKDNIPLRLPVLKIDDNIIERETKSKFLGVILDENITWKSHIEQVENKISKNIGIIAKVSNLLNTSCLKNIYFSLVHSYVNYANIAWANTNKTKLKSINSKQKQCSRYIYHKETRTHAKPLLLKLNAMNVYQINIYQHLIFMFKVRNNLAPQVFKNSFECIEHNFQTRFRINNFRQPRRITKKTSFAISKRGPLLWNEILTNSIKEYTSLNLFKFKTKEFILNSLENEIKFF